MGILFDLGADQSFIYQFSIVIIMFFLTKKLFLNHLQNILDTRENKTIKSVSDSSQKEEEIKNLQEKYHNELSSSLKTIREKVEVEKNIIHKEIESKYKAEEEIVNAKVQADRDKNEKEFAEKKNEVLKATDSLSSDLLKKLLGEKA